MKIVTMAAMWKAYANRSGITENLSEVPYRNCRVSYYSGMNEILDLIFGEDSDNFANNVEEHLDVFASEMDDFQKEMKEEKEKRQKAGNNSDEDPVKMFLDTLLTALQEKHGEDKHES